MMWKCLFINVFIITSCFSSEVMPYFTPSPAARRFEEYTKLSNLKKTYPPEFTPFVNTIEQTSPNNVSFATLKQLLEDPAAVEAVVTYTPPSIRNSFIEFLFFGSVLYKKKDVVKFFLDNGINLEKMRSTYNESPAEFAHRVENTQAFIMFRQEPVIAKKS